MRTASLFILTSLLVPSVTFAQDKDFIYLPKNLYLVAARTVEVGKREVAGTSIPGPKKIPAATIPEARFEITKIYVGPDWLKRHPIFTCDQVPHQITVISPLDRLHVKVAFEKGVEGLWWVSYDPAGSGSLRPVRQAGYVDALGIRPFPYQKMMRDGERFYKTPKEAEAGYREGLAWAEAAAKVYRAKTDLERSELLRDIAAEHSPRSTWAIACLAHSRQKEWAPFFRKLLADPKQPIENQVILDGALASLEETDWEGSKEQRALHERWRTTYRRPSLPTALQVLEAQGKWLAEKSLGF